MMCGCRLGAIENIRSRASRAAVRCLQLALSGAEGVEEMPSYGSPVLQAEEE